MKGREEIRHGREGERTVFGFRPVEALLHHAPERIERIFVVRESRRERELVAFEELIAKLGINVRTVDRRFFETRFADLPHQGIAAIVRDQEPESLEGLLAQPAAGRSLLVALDEVTDPHNLGAIFRVAEATGARALLYPEMRSAGLTPIVSKASAGASELLPSLCVKNMQRALSKLREAGYWVIGTALEPGAKGLYESDVPEPCVLVFGAEGSGLRPIIRRECDMLLSIPMVGRIEALSVSQAATVVLYEFLRRREAKRVPQREARNAKGEGRGAKKKGKGDD